MNYAQYTTTRIISALKTLDKEQSRLDAKRATLNVRAGKHVQKLRRSRFPKKTLKQVAAHLGSGIKYPWSLERGEAHWTPETLRRVAAFLE